MPPNPLRTGGGVIQGFIEDRIIRSFEEGK
jgi:hypothetical protein